MSHHPLVPYGSIVALPMVVKLFMIFVDIIQCEFFCVANRIGTVEVHVRHGITVLLGSSNHHRQGLSVYNISHMSRSFARVSYLPI